MIILIFESLTNNINICRILNKRLPKGFNLWNGFDFKNIHWYHFKAYRNLSKKRVYNERKDFGSWNTGYNL